MAKRSNRIYVSRGMKARLQGVVRASRRDTIYRMLSKQNDGTVPCFVCGRHVKEKNATLEHKVPQSAGGTDDMENLSISHYQCNQRRGATLPPFDTSCQTVPFGVQSGT